MLWLLAALAAPASADTFELANGSSIEGTLATYELGGNCQIFVSSGPVRGATLLLPCTEIVAMQRAGARVQPGAALAAPLSVEEVAAPAAVVLPAAGLAEAPAATAPVEPAAPAEPAVEVHEVPAEPEPVAASLPDGYVLPGARPDDGVAAAEPAPAAPAPANLRSLAPPAPPAAPSVEAPAAAAPTQGEAPEGWQEKGEGPQLPRWLHRALYGDAPAEQPEGDGDDT